MSMSNRGHNKKRNTGLLYEFLVQDISHALVENDQRRSSLALKLLKKHFKAGSALHREFRLINSLIKTTVSSEAVAASIMQEAKNAARAYDKDVLDREKSLLIRNINHRINDDVFYDRHINEYKMYATIQTLLNDWRSSDADLERLASYEDQLVKWLTSPKPTVSETFINEESTGQGRMLMRLMMKKLNEKYSGILNESQKSIVRAYVWASAQENQESIRSKLKSVQIDLIESIDSFVTQNPENEFVNKKLSLVKEQLSSESLDVVNDDTVTRFMLYVKLNEELTTPEETQ